MKTRKLNVGPHIWFVLHYDSNGDICALEEHDMREGGHIRKNDDMTWEDYFLKNVVDRCGGDEYKKVVLEKASEFLASNEPEITV